jgi:hypothetical protein
VSDYILEDRTTGVRSPAETDFSSRPCVQTSSGAHPASCPMGAGGRFPGLECYLGVTLTTHTHLVLRSRISRNYISSPHFRLHGGNRTGFTLLVNIYYRCLLFYYLPTFHPIVVFFIFQIVAKQRNIGAHTLTYFYEQ